MTQPDLFDRLTGQAPQRYRKGDPQTSRLAANDSQSFVSGQRKQIFDVLAASAAPMAAEEIGDALGFSHVQICRRISELLDGGQIETADQNYKNRSGSKARRFRVRRACA